MSMKRSAYEKWSTGSQLGRITNWAANGCTMAELASNMGISPSTLYKMQAEHPDVAEAIEGGRGMSVQHVENALFRSALGLDYEEGETTEEQTAPDGSRRVIVRRSRTRVKPSVSAQIFYLKNRAGYRDNPAPRPGDAASGIPDDPLSAALDDVACGLEDGRHGA